MTSPRKAFLDEEEQSQEEGFNVTDQATPVLPKNLRHPSGLSAVPSVTAEPQSVTVCNTRIKFFSMLSVGYGVTLGLEKLGSLLKPLPENYYYLKVFLDGMCGTTMTDISRRLFFW